MKCGIVNMKNKTLRQIEDVLGRIRIHPEYSDCLKKRELYQLREEANRHSVNIEAESGEHTTSKQKAIFTTDAYKTLIGAQKYLCQNGINLSSLSTLGKILEPGTNIANFRTSAVKFGEFAGAEPQIIIYKMRDLTERLSDPILHPILRAIDAHATIVQVHPWTDGNGRAARLVQDIYLQGASCPPAIIPTSERRLYIALMNGLLKDRLEKNSSVYEPTEREELFHEFIQSKILSSSQKLEEELRSRRVYTINLYDTDSPGHTLALKKALIGSHGDALEVHVDSQYKSGRVIILTVTGNVGIDELISRTKPLCAKYHLKSDIHIAR
jgi:hypothetical protein